MNYRPIYDDTGKPAAWVKALAGKSGVYIIRENFTGSVLYVGESHTGRVKKTLLHHFQSWSGPTSGPTYHPGTHDAAVITTPPEHAVEAQNNLIESLTPEHNTQGNDWLARLLG